MNSPSFLLSFTGPVKLIGRAFMYVVVFTFFHVTVVNYFLGKLSFDWGENPDFRARLHYVKQNANQYNALFIGSSIIKNHINPIIFDSVVSGKFNIRSFNLGTDGMFVPTTFYIAEQLIRDTALKLQYLIVDYDGINDLSRFLHHQKANYWINGSYLKFTLAATWAGEMPLRSKAKFIYQYGTLFLEKSLGRGNPYLFRYHEEKGELPAFEKAHHGFSSLQNQLVNMSKAEGAGLKARHKNFVADTSSLKTAFVKSLQIKEAVQQINQPFFDKLIQLIGQANSRGIRLIYLFQPRNADKPIYTEYEALPAANKLCVSLDPALYTAVYHFDNKHLNDSGAVYFSKVVAQRFRKIADHPSP